MLSDAVEAPVVRWPADCVHVITARGPDDEPDLELPPLPLAPPQAQPEDALILERVTQSDNVSIRAVAADLRLSRQKVWRALRRMRDLGLVAFDGEAWLAR